jgi:hypothetical protein
MDREVTTTASRRLASLQRQGIIAASCAAGMLFMTGTAQAKPTHQANRTAGVIHSSVLRGQLSGQTYNHSLKDVPADGTVTNHWDVRTHTDTPHTDNGLWPFHTDNAHGDGWSHGDESTAPATNPSP